MKGGRDEGRERKGLKEEKKKEGRKG